MPALSSPPAHRCRIRTDSSNAFAHYTMLNRVPDIIESVRQRNDWLSASARLRLQELCVAICANHPLPPIDPRFPGASEWQSALDSRCGDSWLATDWFFAENYLYRQIVDITEYWVNKLDPFGSHKLEQYHSSAHERTMRQADRASRTEACVEHLMLMSVFANRVDLSHPAAQAQGVESHQDLLLDDRREAIELLNARQGIVHCVVDNAGTELSVDLLLADAIMQQFDAPVTLHIKLHPAFVSDAVSSDLSWLLGTNGPSDSEALWRAWGAHDCRTRLRSALDVGQLKILSHGFWNGPASLWEMPADLQACLGGARLVILKGDAHYRRSVGDAIWPDDTSFRSATSYLHAPLLVLRTLKSDPLVGVPRSTAQRLDALDATWRVNGQRGVACLGGQTG